MNVEELKIRLKTDFCNSFDLVVIQNTIGSRPCVYAYFDGLTDKELLETGIIEPLSKAKKDMIKNGCNNDKSDADNTNFSVGVNKNSIAGDGADVNANTSDLSTTDVSTSNSKVNASNNYNMDIINIDYIYNNSHSSAPIEMIENLQVAEKCICENLVIIWVDDKFFSVDLRKMEKRAIAEPPTSSVLKGPRSGFVEEIAVNVSLIRRRIKTRDLIIQGLTVGKYTKTAVAVCFMSGIADENLVKTVVDRINNIDIDGIIDSSYIAMLIEDNKQSLFSQVGTQEKPDIVVAKILEGRIAIIVDGSPMVLTLPYMLIESFQDSEDYYRRNRRASFVRLLRLLGLIISIILPAAYVAVQEYQYQFLPLKFLITINNATNGTPFTPTYEMFLVLIIFDILNEASVRMPRFVGMALSIVGAIVLGETAVQAGLLSSPAVLVMALSAIGMYTAPNNMGTFSLIRLIFLAVSSFFGILGLVAISLIFVSCITSLKSFGSDFTAPYSPFIKNDLQDGFLKNSIVDIDLRPETIHTHNKRRKN